MSSFKGPVLDGWSAPFFFISFQTCIWAKLTKMGLDTSKKFNPNVDIPELSGKVIIVTGGKLKNKLALNGSFG